MFLSNIRHLDIQPGVLRGVIEECYDIAMVECVDLDFTLYNHQQWKPILELLDHLLVTS